MKIDKIKIRIQEKIVHKVRYLPAMWLDLVHYEALNIVPPRKGKGHT